jgi:[ribosomal protein S5]-alanine N-acetyltransferase
MRIIHTERLRLVPVTPANARLLWDVLQEPDLRDYQDLPDIGLRQFLDGVETRPNRLEIGASGRFEWLMFFNVDNEDEPLGWISLRIAARTTSTAEIGYSVVADYRGRGIATEAVAALVEEGFRHAKLRRLRAYCVPENLSSRAVLRRAGFVDDGILPHGATVSGQPVDVVAHVLERARWEKRLTRNQAAIRS